MKCDNPTPLFLLRGHEKEVNSLCFRKAQQDEEYEIGFKDELERKLFSDLLYSASADGEIKVWNLEKRRCIYSKKHAHGKKHSLVKDNGSILALKITEKGLISQGRDGFVKLWDLEKMENSSSIQVRDSPKMKLFSNCTSFGTFSVMSTDNRAILSIPGDNPNNVRSITNSE